MWWLERISLLSFIELAGFVMHWYQYLEIEIFVCRDTQAPRQQSVNLCNFYASLLQFYFPPKSELVDLNSSLEVSACLHTLILQNRLRVFLRLHNTALCLCLWNNIILAFHATGSMFCWKTLEPQSRIYLHRNLSVNALSPVFPQNLHSIVREE